MTTMQRDAHDALVNEIAELITHGAFDDLPSYAIAGNILDLIFSYVGNVTEEMQNAGCSRHHQHPNDVFRTMLLASALFPGEKT